MTRQTKGIYFIYFCPSSFPTFYQLVDLFASGKQSVDKQTGLPENGQGPLHCTRSEIWSAPRFRITSSYQSRTESSCYRYCFWALISNHMFVWRPPVQQQQHLRRAWARRGRTLGEGGGGQERHLLPRYSVYHTQGIVLLAAVKMMVALVSYSGSGRRRPGALPSPSLFSISFSRYSSPCCRPADGGTSFLLWEWSEEARSATFSLAIQYIILKV